MEAATAQEAAHKMGEAAVRGGSEGKSRKKKSDKKERKETRKRRKEVKAAEAKGPIKTSIKPGRFGDAGSSGLKPTQLFDDHVHQFGKEFIQASVKLKEENKHTEFVNSFKSLALEMKKVDQNLVLEYVVAGVKQGRVEDPRFLSNNFTELSAVVKLAANTRFERVKPWGNRKRNHEVDEDGLEDPEVYFTFCVSCDEEPEEIVERVRHEWSRKGGNKLEVSELRCLETAPAMVLFNVFNGGNLTGIRAEAVRLMKGAARHEKDMEMEVDDGEELLVPEISLQIQVPKIPGQDTSQFENWNWKDANKRKAVHIRCNVEEVGRVQALLEVAKEKN